MIPLIRMTAAALAAVLGSSLAQAQTTEIVSSGAGGAQADGWSAAAAISFDGRYVAFVSVATNLVAGDTNGVHDVFVRDWLNGTTERVSVDSAGLQGDGPSGYSLFQAIQPSISADGRFVVFESSATNLVAGDTNFVADVFVRDRQLGTTERISVDSGGLQGNMPSGRPSISADGGFVVFESNATTLVAGDTNLSPDIFVRDRLNGTTERVSVSSTGAQANSASSGSAISSDGRFVAFTSLAGNLVAVDNNLAVDIFVRDRLNGTTELASVSSTGAQGMADSYTCSISASGRCVALGSWSPNLVSGDVNAMYDIFVHDRPSGATELVSVDSNKVQGDGGSYTCSISGDGRFVAFESFATNLVPGDTNGGYDAFVRDRQDGTTERVSVDAGGAQGNNWSRAPSISADGRLVAFESGASNLVAGDTNATSDIFVRDRGARPVTPFCFGDVISGACPCGNQGVYGSGCENSASTGGATLRSAGAAALANDTLVLTSSGELPSVLSIFLQGNTAIAAVHFGDGLRCTGGILKRLFVLNASGGSVSAPPAGALSISARSAVLGDTIGAGTTRHYQVYYRDPLLGFCASPQGDSWNISSGLSVLWN